jgi:class 3 adenylate cyclase/tetratricopeptide (TPR) repeat protein
MEPCPRCGTENPYVARFCQACGETLEQQRQASGEIRKTVTVLFLDVVGSTELGERLDPESVRHVMSRLFEVVRPMLERHGGTVEKFIGDAVMAVFGVPTVHEDDALRACRAALEIQEEIGRLNKELERDWGMTIATRTGLNTGEVIAGDPTSGQTLVTGDPVNTAARLEQAAAPGTVLIGEPTFRLVTGAVEVEPVGPVAAKGKAEAVTAYRLLSVAPGVPVRARRLNSPMVGRERELGVLTDASERSVAESRCVLATVIGMPGVGKSRLVHEFVASASDRATVLRGRCLPYGEGITFWPVANVVHEAARITEGDSPEEARSRIEALLPEGDDRVILRDRVAAAIGIGEATWSIQETFWAVRRLLESVASDRPLIVVFDDIQWAEPAFLDLIEYLEGWSRAAPILVLCMARPELLETRAGWASAASEPTSVALEPLSGEESDRLIQNLLGSSAVSDRFRGRIAEAAEGNPLFVEEMLGMLIDEDRLRREEGRWVASDEGASVPTPPTIQSLLAARIEQLPEAERELLQRASVIGKAFWWGAVVDLSAGDRTRISSQLQDLVRKGVIRPDQSSFAGQDAFRFRHLLIRDAAYESVPRAVRADLHERLATWIEATFGERIEEYEEIVGYHLEQACRQRLSSSTGDRGLSERASRILASAGRRALDRGDLNAAVHLLPRAWDLNPIDDTEFLEVRLLFGEAVRRHGDFMHADEVLVDLERRARAIGDRSLEWKATIERLLILSSTTNLTFEEAKPSVDRAIEVFGELGDDEGLAKSWDFLAWMHFNSGRCADALEAYGKAAHHAEAAGDTALFMDESSAEATQASYGPTPVTEGLLICDETLERVKGHPAIEAWVYEGRSRLEAMLGNVEAARAAITRARSVAHELGATHTIASMSKSAADVEWYAGDISAEERERRSGYEAFVRSGANAYRATWAAWLAVSLVRLERDADEALDLTRESESLAGEDDITAQVPWRDARAMILARRGEMGEALKLAREAVDIAERTDWLNLQGDAQMTLAKVLQLAGQSEEAAIVARAAAERYERKGDVVATGWARALEANLAPPPSETP